MLIRYFISFTPKPCREAEIAPGVGVVQNVEGSTVELVVVPYLEEAEVAVAVVLYLENRAGMSHSRSFATQTHFFVSIFAEGQPAVIDTRLANSAEDRLISSFRSLSLRQDAMPPRPDYGTKG